jgi:hypothetical protein
MPAHWYDVYPRNTKEGDEEEKIFTSLARHATWAWRSVSAIAKETGIDKERVEEVLYKYFKKNMVFQNPKNEDQWGYWSRVPEMLNKPNKKSIRQEDVDKRLNLAVSQPPSSKDESNTDLN